MGEGMDKGNIAKSKLYNIVHTSIQFFHFFVFENFHNQMLRKKHSKTITFLTCSLFSQ